MRRLALLSVLFAASCSSADFDVAAAVDDAATVTDSAAADTGGVIESDAAPPVDADPPPMDASGSCEPIQHSSTDVYVDSKAAAGGLGSVGCPFRTLAEAANTSFATGYDRIVHVRAGSYTETKPIKVRSRETYRSDDGVARVIGKGTALCASGKTCVFDVTNPGGLNGFEVDASAVINGIYVTTAGLGLTIKNTTVVGAQAEGIVVTGTGAVIGPNVSVLESGGSAIVMRGNALLKVTGGGNTFNNSKNAGAGIHMFSGMLLLEGGTTTVGNSVGVLFDAAGFSMGQQTLGLLTSQLNRTAGVVVNKGWSKVTFRNCELTKNTNYGARLEFNSLGTNVFDLGVAAAGGNVFGGAGIRNGKAGLFLCGSRETASLKAEGNSWMTCPAPKQEQTANCDTGPSATVDVAYVPAMILTGPGDNPVATPTSCTTGP